MNLDACPNCIKYASAPHQAKGEYTVKVIGRFVHLADQGDPVCGAK